MTPLCWLVVFVQRLECVAGCILSLIITYAYYNVNLCPIPKLIPNIRYQKLHPTTDHNRLINVVSIDHSYSKKKKKVKYMKKICSFNTEKLIYRLEAHGVLTVQLR